MDEIKRTLKREERSWVAMDKFARDLGRSNLSFRFILLIWAARKAYTRRSDRILEIHLLTKISIINFKGIKQVELSLSPLTVFVGENATGKSTVLQALSILKRSTSHLGINTELAYANLGPLSLLVPPAQTCTIAFQGWSDARLKPLGIERVSFGCSVSFDGQGLSAYNTRLIVSDRDMLRNEWNRYGVQLVDPQTWKSGKITIHFRPTNIIGMAFDLGGYGIEGSATPDESKAAQDLHQNFAKLSSVIMSVLERFFVVAPLRGLTEPVYSLQPNPTQEFTPRAGTVQLGGNLATNLVYNRPNVARISEWQAEIVGVGVETDVVPGAQVLVKNPDGGIDFVNEGFGSNQLLFVLERVANSPPDSVIGVEEPEIHLHPKAQFRFGKWASKTVPALGKQLTLLTHSPDVVSGILAGVRGKKIKPEDVSIWFFERKDHEIVSTRSEVDADGKVSGPALKAFLESTADQLWEKS